MNNSLIKADSFSTEEPVAGFEDDEEDNDLIVNVVLYIHYNKLK